MNFQQFFGILASRWRTAALTAFIVTSLAIGISLLLPKKYVASAAVLLDVSTPDPVAGTVFSGMQAPSYMATQVDLARSERVALRAIDILGVASDPAHVENWKAATQGVGSYPSWLAGELLLGLSVEPSRESNVLTLTYQSTDAAFAAAAANAFMQAFIDVSLELRVEPARQFSTFFDERAKQLRESLQQAQTKLSEFQRANGLLSGNDGRIDIETARLNDLSSQMVVLQSMAAESSGRQSQAGSRGDQLSEVISSPVVVQLTGDLAREEARLRELTSRLGDANPQVIEQRVRVGELKSRLDTATSRATGSVAVANNVAQSRLAQTRAALDAQRERVSQMKALRDQSAVLERDVENAQRAYDAMLQRLSQTSIESKTTRTNVSVVKQASQPTESASPNKRLNAIMGLIVGITLGLAIIIGRELFDRRLRTEDDIITELRQPLLVRLPVAAHGGPDNSRTRLVKSRVLTGLPRPAAHG